MGSNLVEPSIVFLRLAIGLNGLFIAGKICRARGGPADCAWGKGTIEARALPLPVQVGRLARRAGVV